jgi:hypothetical protein
MEVDPPSPVARRPSLRQHSESYTLVRKSQIKLQVDWEKAIFEALKDKEFTATPLINANLLEKIGMDSEFDLIFCNVGWEDDWFLNEEGCKLLTIKFLCTLELRNDDINFRLFNQEFTLTWKKFSNLLKFHESCNLDIDDAIPDYDRTRFWKDISGENICTKPCTDEINNPTLRFMHKWLGVTMFFREDFRIARMEELIIMNIITKKEKFSPIKLMAHYWLTIPNLKRGAVTST